MTNTDALDDWIRSSFMDLNTDLEEMYFQQADRASVQGIGEAEKTRLEREGRDLIRALLEEGNTNEGFDQAFDLLGNVGFYMAACRRHEITDPTRDRSSPLVEASALAMHIAASIGVIPRFATAHLTTHNRAVGGIYKSFTHLEAERIFLDYNSKGIFAYKRAADALLKIQPLGVSHPVTHDLLKAAKQALQDVIDSNHDLINKLDTDRFFYCVRPYYKPHQVGSQTYRGANAGDFAGINVIDLLLGLCKANVPAYSRILVDKFLYMMPEDQAILRDCMRRQSYMDTFLAAQDQQHEPWYQTNLRLFLDVCDLHGEAAIQHHNQLVETYIAEPSKKLTSQHMATVTASGPPLSVLLRALENLRDYRAAHERDDIPTRFADIAYLRASLEQKQEPTHV
ncbi:MAG: monodechloroaminopyrrolnitrin synthase PrnB family protein [Deinococcota bacterium]